MKDLSAGVGSGSNGGHDGAANAIALYGLDDRFERQPQLSERLTVNHSVTLAETLRRYAVKVVGQFERRSPSAAKAATGFAALTARLEAVPFQSKFKSKQIQTPLTARLEAVPFQSKL